MPFLVDCSCVPTFLKQIEVWLETAARGARTPIHGNSSEEVFIAMKGSGRLYIASDSDASYPGKPQEHHISSNSTFHVPANAVHQVWNTNEHEDLQFLAIKSSPPVKVFIYEDWFMPHTAAKLKFPMF